MMRQIGPHILLLLVTPSPANCQDNSKPTGPWTISRDVTSFEHGFLSIEHFWVAQISTDELKVKLLKPKTRIEFGKETKDVQRFRQQTHNKTRTLADGKTELYSEQVTIPYTETVQISRTVPDGTDRFEVPLNEVKAWSLDGTPIEPKVLAKQLKTPVKLFVYTKYPEEDFQGLDPYYRGAFDLRVLVLRLPADLEKQNSKYSIGKPVPPINGN